MKTKPLYIALGMVLGAAVLALIAAAPDPGILHVPGISVVGTNAANIVIATNSIRNPALPNTGIYYSGAFSIFRVASNDIAVVGSSRFGMPYLDTEEGFTLRDSSGNMISRGATGVGALIGSGSPDGVITLPPGSMYLNTSGGSGTTLYLKESGAGNTGWAGVASGGSAVWTNSFAVPTSPHLQLLGGTNVFDMIGEDNSYFDNSWTLIENAIKVLPTVTNSGVIWGLGAFNFDGSFVTNSSDLFGIGDGTMSGSVFVNSGPFAIEGGSSAQSCFFTNAMNISTYGDNNLQGSTLTHVQDINAEGSSILSGAFLTNVIFATFLGNSAGGGTPFLNLSNSTDVFLAGNSATVVSGTGLNHVAVFGSHGVATNANDWVAGDSAYNYFFPGASATFDGPITAKQGISAGGTAPSYFTNGVQDATITSKVVMANATNLFQAVTGTGIITDTGASANKANVVTALGFTPQATNSTTGAFGATTLAATATVSLPIIMPYGGHITGWSISADGTSPTVTFDVLHEAAGGTAIPSVSIMGTKPALAAGNVVHSTAVSDWATNFNAGDIFMIKVDTGNIVSTAVQLTLETLR